MSLDAERALLGSVFLDGSAWDVVGNMVRAEDFEHYNHGKVWSTIESMVADGKPIDLVTVSGACDVPAPEIAELTSVVPSSANAKHYATIVHDGGVKRNAIRVLRETLERTQELESASDIIEHVESRIFDLHDRSGGQYQHVRTYIKGAVEQIEENYKAHVEGRTVGIPSGLRDLDELTGGFRDQDVIVIGARPRSGCRSLETFRLRLPRLSSRSR